MVPIPQLANKPSTLEMLPKMVRLRNRSAAQLRIFFNMSVPALLFLVMHWKTGHYDTDRHLGVAAKETILQISSRQNSFKLVPSCTQKFLGE